MTGARGLSASKRARLLIVLLGASFLVSILAINAAGSSLSYYVTPEEFQQHIGTTGSRYRVGGRVVGESVETQDGRPVRFVIEGDDGQHMTIAYPEGPVPSLFGPRAFVVVEGEADGPGRLLASSVIIKHENEFLTATPTPAPAY